jgi:hypothetical protein
MHFTVRLPEVTVDPMLDQESRLLRSKKKPHDEAREFTRAPRLNP